MIRDILPGAVVSMPGKLGRDQIRYIRVGAYIVCWWLNIVGALMTIFLSEPPSFVRSGTR